MTVDPFAHPSATVPNLRDLGERPVIGGGRLPAGRVFRAGEPSSPAAPADLGRLGLATVIDLRTAGEVAQRPDRLPDGVTYRHLDVLADMPPEMAEGQAHLMNDPVAFADAFGRIDPIAQMHRTYAELVVAPSAREAYGTLLREVLEADGAPVLVHCTAGKDRTGWAVTVLLLAAGVPVDAVKTEYLAVNPAVRAVFAPLIDRYAAAGAPREMLEPMLEVRSEYLDTALARVDDVFGGFDGYLHDGLGLTTDESAALRAVLVR